MLASAGKKPGHHAAVFSDGGLHQAIQIAMQPNGTADDQQQKEGGEGELGLFHGTAVNGFSDFMAYRRLSAAATKASWLVPSSGKVASP